MTLAVLSPYAVAMQGSPGIWAWIVLGLFVLLGIWIVMSNRSRK